MRQLKRGILITGLIATFGALVIVTPSLAQTTTPAPAPTPLSTPGFSGPLSQLPPAIFDAGPLHTISFNGVISGFGMWQSNHVTGDNPAQAALSNGQVFLQKDDGPVQFYVQAGAYALPALATPFLAADKTVTGFYGPVPQAFLKLAPAKNTSILIGALPTLIGAEYTFSFENMNIERGLLWNQENAVNRGIQLNQTMGKFNVSLSWNDGFYSNRYSWISGSVNYTSGPHSLTFIGMGNTSATAYQTAATPVQNNSSIYNVIYTYTKGLWIIQPYIQYSNVPTNSKIGITKGASTTGGAILVSRTFRHGISLPARFESISSSGSAAQNSVNLLFGPGSAGTSITLTPTYQRGGLFLRGDLSWVHAINSTRGDTFSHTGNNPNQPRAVAEIGFIFGNNIEK